ncbi:hypothetical protein GGF50DRAFT_117448 [Schizophyllum commune]
MIIVPAGQKSKIDARGGWEGMRLERGAAQSAAALAIFYALSKAKKREIETEGRREGWGLCEARHGAPPPLYRAVDEKFRKSTSNAPRSARESLADGRDMDFSTPSEQKDLQIDVKWTEVRA